MDLRTKGRTKHFFALLTMLLYAAYVRKKGVALYVLALTAFALGLMTKSMLVTLPCVLLLLDYWPLERLSQTAKLPEPRRKRAQTLSIVTPSFLVWEKLPFFLLSALICLITFYAQRNFGAVFERLPLGQRLSNAFVAYVHYIAKALYPTDLAVFYPHPFIVSRGRGLPYWQPFSAALLLLSITAFVVRYRKQRPHLAVGWFWFIGTLVPVIGIVQVGAQAMADRYAYIPLIGLSLMVA